MRKLVTLVFIIFSYSAANAQITESKEILIEEVKMAEEPEISRDIPFSIIENVPIFPGCTGSQLQKKQCLNKSVRNHVAKNFNLKKIRGLKLSPGKKKIYVKFKINKNGEITKIVARGPHKKAEKEGIRVVKSLPKMVPGKQRGRNVNVTYMLPITFNIK
jgi:protein TonB